MKYLMNSLLFLGLLVIGSTVAVVITGQEAQARGESVNPLYGLGYCTYKMQGHFDICFEVFWRRVTDKEYQQCMEDTPYPDACIDSKEVIQS